MAVSAVPMAFAAGLLAALAAAGAWAAEPPAPPAPTPIGAGLVALPAETAADTAPLALQDLDAETAGAAPDVNVLSNQQLTATNSGNSVNAETVQSGDIAFSDSAFSGFNGVGNFVFNTGANNNLQGVVSVNVVSVPEL